MFDEHGRLSRPQLSYIKSLSKLYIYIYIYIYIFIFLDYLRQVKAMKDRL
jgi:hypothetical protein